VIAAFLAPPPIGGAPENPNTPDKTVTVTRPPLIAGQKLGPIGPTQDDISLLWLAPGANIAMAVSELEASGTAGIGLGQIFYSPSLLPMFNARATARRRSSHSRYYRAAERRSDLYTKY
jgi:hypothetical protein